MLGSWRTDDHVKTVLDEVLKSSLGGHLSSPTAAKFLKPDILEMVELQILNSRNSLVMGIHDKNLLYNVLSNYSDLSSVAYYTRVP